MNFLKLIWFIVYLQTRTNVLGDITRDVHFINKSMDWKTANSYCSLYGSNESEHFTNIIINTTVEVPQNITVWISAKPVFTPWVRLLGCFQYGNIRTGTSLGGNVTSCVQQCIGRDTFVGLDETRCFCFNYLPSQNESCDPRPCSGNSLDVCVQSNDVAVFYGTGNGIENSVIDWTVRHTNKSYVYSRTREEESLPYACRVQWVTGFSEYRLFKEKYMYHEAKGKCQNLTEYGRDFPRDNSITRAWIGIDWNMVNLAWGHDKTLTDQNQCIAAILNNGKLQPQFVQCSSTYHVLCDQIRSETYNASTSDPPTFHIALGVGIVVVLALATTLTICILCAKKRYQKQSTKEKGSHKISFADKNAITSTNSEKGIVQMDYDYSEVGDNNIMMNRDKIEKNILPSQRSNEEQNDMNDKEYSELLLKTNINMSRNLDDTYDHVLRDGENQDGMYDHTSHAETERTDTQTYDTVGNNRKAKNT